MLFDAFNSIRCVNVIYHKNGNEKFTLSCLIEEQYEEQSNWSRKCLIQIKWDQTRNHGSNCIRAQTYNVIVKLTENTL